MSNWSWLIVAVIFSIAFAVPATADEPSGFGQFGWGTPRAQIAQHLAGQCSRQIALDTVRGQSLLCFDYQVDGLGPAVLIVEFADDTLQGYTVRVPRGRAATLRTLSERRLGAAMATGLAGGVLSWSWPSGERALFDEHCLAWDDACLTVRTSKAVRTGLDAVERRK